jgi:NAD(P)-dependent dehydrogenase (short-subunit alcohol dehydrogenase family)
VRLDGVGLRHINDELITPDGAIPMRDKSIFVTGAASGIGRATVELFHGKGWLVGCYDLNEAALLELENQLGDGCIVCPLDVADKAAFDQAMSDFAERTQNRLDIMFNNAGVAIFGYLDELPFDKVMQTVNVNLVGVLNGVHAAMPLLKQTENSLCFSTSSSAATFGAPGLATYAATKYAVKGLTEALSVELARFGSRAADVLPGIIDTPLWEGTRYVKGEARPARNVARLNADRTDASRTLGAEEVAQCVWEAYHGDRLHYYVPAELIERDRASAASPEKMRDELIARSR